MNILKFSKGIKSSSSLFGTQVNIGRRNATRILYAIIPNKYPKYCTPDEAVSCINSNFNIYVHGGAATPTTLLSALAKRAVEKDLKNIRAYHIHMEGPGIMTEPNMIGHIRSNSLFTGANCRKAVEAGTADFIPVFLSNIPRTFREEIIKLNCVLITVCPPDEHGFVSLGTSVDSTLSAVEKADIVIALVNKQMARSFGDGTIHISQIDYAVNVDKALHYAHETATSKEELAIGKYIAENLIEDGSTLQMGIGSIPNAVMTQIKNQRHLGVHTEMISDSVAQLVQSGVADNSRKVVYPGKTVSSFSVGTQKLYDFINNNPTFLMMDAAFTNDPAVIGQNPKVISINSCIEIDLTGQVVSDSIGPKIHSGVGGQVDFVSGAVFSKDGKGKSVLAMNSQTKRKESKIVPYVKEGSGVTTSRNHVQYIVTEFGIAYLAGKTLPQRAYELIKIAHPDARPSLEKAAFERLKTMPCRD